MRHSTNTAYQRLNNKKLNLNRIIIEQHDDNKHEDYGPMAQLKSSLIFLRILDLFPSPRHHHPVPFIICLHKLVHPYVDTSLYVHSEVTGNVTFQDTVLAHARTELDMNTVDRS